MTIYILLLQMNLVVGILGPVDFTAPQCQQEIIALKKAAPGFLTNIDLVCYASNHKPNLGDLYPFVGSRK